MKLHRTHGGWLLLLPHQNLIFLSSSGRKLGRDSSIVLFTCLFLAPALPPDVAVCVLSVEVCPLSLYVTASVSMPSVFWTLVYAILTAPNPHCKPSNASFCLWDRVLLSSVDCSQTCDPPAFYKWEKLGLKSTSIDKSGLAHAVPACLCLTGSQWATCSLT